MTSVLRGIWQRFVSAGAAGKEAEEVPYNGYLIQPTPYLRNGSYQTCGIIIKDAAGERREHRFVRAETHPSRKAAVAFSIAKARQLIDEQGARLFR